MRHAVCNAAGRTRKSARFGQGSAATAFSPAAGFLASQLTPPGSQGRGLMTLVNGEMQAQFMARIRGLDPQRCQSSSRRSLRGQPHRLPAWPWGGAGGGRPYRFVLLACETRLEHQRAPA